MIEPILMPCNESLRTSQDNHMWVIPHHYDASRSPCEFCYQVYEEEYNIGKLHESVGYSKTLSAARFSENVSMR